MRLFGGSAMLALPFVFVPQSWMEDIHREWLGMGPLPEEPIVGYLARSTSMFYFIMGGLMLLMSFDLRRYRPPIGYLLGTSLLFGAVLVGVDLYEGMPLYWVVCEGPGIMLISSVMLMLWRRQDTEAD
jgi:hypothetical protein